MGKIGDREHMVNDTSQNLDFRNYRIIDLKSQVSSIKGERVCTYKTYQVTYEYLHFSSSYEWNYMMSKIYFKTSGSERSSWKWNIFQNSGRSCWKPINERRPAISNTVQLGNKHTWDLITLFYSYIYLNSPTIKKLKNYGTGTKYFSEKTS